MKLALVGHSFVHMRQWLWARELSNQGHMVLVVTPKRWRHLGVMSYSKPWFRVLALPASGEPDIYHFEMKGARRAVEKFQPDWLYVQQEAQSDLAEEALDWDLGGRRALFVWENIHQPQAREQAILRRYDLIVTGNLEAYEIARPWCQREPLLLPQVGVCPDLFRPLPVAKTVDVAFFGRPVPEKGLEYLLQAWPRAQVMEGANYDELTEWYNQAQVVVCYSQDNPPAWKEQSMPYVAAEALACGTPVICSTTASSVFWLNGCPGVKFVPQHNPQALHHTIDAILRHPPPSGREYIVRRLSNQVVASRLVEAFQAVEKEQARVQAP